ncbi:hypothetical protein B0H67DRAFT_638122 [Lasiosphaeris hirsuta]|uniref:Rhodopsin domain-containing protein n=1 Tax=Lasiosphaeris hirsuta TaxID=260670 RepID=A0AA40E9X7_9PEZI|nr:hypothetical protein B0H67DRAFT_638122 [Lasiosphaeris hirsuta]
MSSADGVITAPSPTTDETIAYRLIIVAVLFPVLAFIFLALRLFSATFIIRKWHLDDYFILVAFFVALANSLVCIVQTKYGLGRHIWDVAPGDLEFFLKLGMIGGALTYNLATFFIKLSILSFYLRFSVDRAFRYTVYFVMLVTVGYTFPNAILFLYACTPMQTYWDLSIVGTCINLNATFHTANTLNMVTDFTILLLPIWMLRRLRAPLMKKIGVTLILMTGGFVCAVSLVRMITALVGIADPDISWHYVSNLVWCLVELYVGIICACLPCLKAFAKRYFPNLFLFDPEIEQRITGSFHISKRPARFSADGGRPEIDGIGDGGERFTKATVVAVGEGVFRSKHSKESEDVEKVRGSEDGMHTQSSSLRGKE